MLNSDRSGRGGSAGFGALATRLGARAASVIVKLFANCGAVITDLSAFPAIFVRAVLHCLNGSLAFGDALIASLGALFHFGHGALAARLSAGLAVCSALGACFNAFFEGWGYRHVTSL